MGFFSKFFGKQAPTTLMSKKQLTQEFIKLLIERIPMAKASIENADIPEEISVSIERPEGDPIIFYPDNLYHAYLQGHEGFVQYRDNIIQNISDLINSAEETEITLLPAIKPISWVNHVAQATKSDTDNNSLVYLPLAGELVIVFALDMGNRMSYLTKDLLKQYSPNNDIQEVYQNAMENFKAFAQRVELQETVMGYMAKLDDNYEASLVLFLNQLLPQLELKGEPIIALIARNKFFIADSHDPRQVSNLRQYAEQQLKEAPYVLSADLFCLKDEKLTLYNLSS